MVITEDTLKNNNAKLLTKDIQIPSINDLEDWLKNSLLPLKDSDHSMLRNVTLEILVTTNTFNQNIESSSAIISLFKDCILTIEELEGYHKLHLVGNEKDKFVSLNKSILTLDFVGYYYEEERAINIVQNNTTIILGSTAPTPCILEILPRANIPELNITGLGEEITLSNLTTNNKIIIDGEKGLVTENGANKFLDYDSWGFPKLVPGENGIIINNTNAEIILKYKARWI